MDKTESKRGLVLQGGGMRGIYTAGVLDVFLEQGIVSFDAVVGVSAGAIHGASYMSGQTGRNIRYFTEFCNDKRFMSVRSWITTGNLFSVEFGYHEIPEKLYPFDEAAFEANPTAFYVVCTNVETGNPVYHRCATMQGDDLEYLRASASLPLAAQIVTVDGKKLLDGGISDGIPLTWAKRSGYDKAVVILTRTAGYRKAEGGMDALYRAMYGREYPVLVRCMRNQTANYNAQMAEIETAEAAGECFVIRPTEDLQLSRTERDASKLRAQYALGRRDAFALLPALKEYLGL